MPFAIDEEKLNNPSLKVMDINAPPMKSIPMEKFPKMVYLHPKDKTKEHLTKIVANAADLEKAEKQGWKVKPHVPVEPNIVESLGSDYEIKSA
jgi:hypothetical protein